jgi:hypothetical protein
MANVDLLFIGPPVDGNPVDLVFGEVEEVTTLRVTVAFSLPGPTVSVDADYLLPPANEGTISMVLGLPTVNATTSHNLNVTRPLVGRTTSRHQTAQPVEAGRQDRAQQSVKTNSGISDRAQQGIKTTGWSEIRQAGTLGSERGGIKVRSQDAAPLRAGWRLDHGEMVRDLRLGLTARSQDAMPLRAQLLGRHQDRIRDRRPSTQVRHQVGQKTRASWGQLDGSGTTINAGWWVRHQEAMRPPAGRSKPVDPPLPEPCYTPNPHLVFAQPAATNGNLLFFCENHEQPGGETVIVPVRSVYIVMNEVLLRRVDGNLLIPARSVSLSIDADSWTWSFSASVPRLAQPDLEPGNSGEPVELEVSINGNLYRVLAETMSRSRSFAQTDIQIGGRGKSALLSSPYAPAMTFANSEQRTAQQLMNDVLTINGVPMGWEIDWKPQDWLVPAGVFNQQGSYIDALNAIAGAAGAYIQPDPVLDKLSVLLRYPVMPWAWDEVTPDFEIPGAVISREGVEWANKPAYNRVFVSGQQSGVLGQVTRTGTDGGLVAPMVTDPLITAAAAARQRGMAVLGDTGRQATFSLALPVLEETGVIPPGKFIRYVDGGVERIGLTRSVSVSSGASAVGMRQTLTVETHE